MRFEMLSRHFMKTRIRTTAARCKLDLTPYNLYARWLAEVMYS